MLKDLKNNNHGVVFVTVLIIIIVTMVLAISALSLNVSQVKSTESELKHLQARILTEGALARILVNQLSGSPTNPISYSETIGNTTFTIVANIDALGAGPPGSRSVPAGITINF